MRPLVFAALLLPFMLPTTALAAQALDSPSLGKAYIHVPKPCLPTKKGGTPTDCSSQSLPVESLTNKAVKDAQSQAVDPGLNNLPRNNSTLNDAPMTNFNFQPAPPTPVLTPQQLDTLRQFENQQRLPTPAP
jgi:hypothetical protein